MSAFVDELKRSWDVRLSVAKIRTVRELTGFDLANLFTEHGLTTLASDVCLLVDVVWVLCSMQAEERGVSQESFGEALYGQAIEDAGNALIDAATDFLPPARRETLQALKAKAEEIGRAAEEKMRAEIAAVDVGEPPPSSGTRWRN